VWSNSLTFDVWNPTVYNLSPYSGPVGTQVTISGAAFGAAQGSGLVWIGTKYAAVVSWSDTEIVATVAADSATGDVQVYQGGVWSNTATFTVTPPASMQNFYVGNDFVGGYTTSYGAVTLTQIAPAGGVVVALTSSDPAVTLPATVTIPENQIQVFFDIEASEVTTPLEATISATLYGTTLEDVIQVLPPGVQYIYFDSQLQTGQPTTGTVILHKAAPSGGAVVSVVSSDSAILSVPSTITVPEGETQTTFTATTGGPVATTTNVSVTASYNGTAAVADWLYLAPPSVVSVTVTPSTIVGGEELTVEVTLSEPAAAGTIVQFQSSHYAVQPPAPLVLGAGATTGEVTFQTSYVPSTTTAVITAAIESWPGASTSVTIERLAITLDSISVSPAELVGSNPATLTVNLTAAAAAGGLEVNLYGFNAGLPPFVVVPEGETSATVPVETYVVEEVSEAYVGAHHGATGLYELITVNPPSGNSVQSLTLATPRTAGGSLVTATLTLDAPAGVGGAAIALESDNLSVATVPASVTIAEGDSTTTFDIDTDAVVEPADVMIRATYGVIRKERLTVVPTEATVSLESLSLDDSHVFRGHPVVFNGEDITGTVTLSAAAPSGGIVVTLGGSRAGIATVPASVTVPEGETSATFTITTEDADNSPYVLVTAAYDGLLRSQMMQVNPNTE
jgi:hypothetical protein